MPSLPSVYHHPKRGEIMKLILMMLITAAVFATACSSAPADRHSVSAAADVLSGFIRGEAVSVGQLLYPGAVYYNGEANSGTRAEQALRKDFAGLQKLELKSEYVAVQPYQEVTVHRAVLKDGSSKLLVTGWHKIRKDWTILFSARADAEGGDDTETTFEEFRKTFNGHDLETLLSRFYVPDPVRVVTSNTVYGIDNVRNCYKLIASDPSMRNTWTVHEKLSDGKDTRLTVGEIYENSSRGRMKFIYVWKRIGDAWRLAVNFDYK